MSNIATIDRRSSSRFARTIAVQIGHENLSLSTINIGLSGALVGINQNLPLNKKVFLKLTLPGQNIPLTTYGRVAWSEKTDEGSQFKFRTGFEFLTLSGFDYKRLQKFIEDSIDETGRDEVHINSDNYTMIDFSAYSGEPLSKRSKYFYSYVSDMMRRGFYNYRRPLVSPCSNRVIVRDDLTGKDREMIMMGSNSYLGLSYHPKVVKAVGEAIEKYGTGAASAPLLAGTFELHKQLEKKIAELKSCEEAVVFPTGYSTNVGVISTLLGNKDFALLDRLCHASIIDGCNMSKVNLKTFRHSDIGHLEGLLKYHKDKYPSPLIMIEGIYSMDGDIAPLPEIYEVAKKYNARIMIDDAHATGVIGKKGRGTVSHFNMEGKIDIIMGTLSKAIGHLGGFIASDREMINYLRHYSRSYFFSTSLPPVVIASCLASLEVMEEEPELNHKLWENIKYFKEGLTELGFRLAPNTESAIVPIIIGEEITLRRMSRRLHEEGIYINPVPYPAVPRNKTRFRATIMATHTREDLDQTLNALEKVGKEFNVIGKARASFTS